MSISCFKSRAFDKIRLQRWTLSEFEVRVYTSGQGTLAITNGPGHVKPRDSERMPDNVNHKLKNVLIMQVLLVSLILSLLPVDCLGFSWPRQTKESFEKEVRTGIPGLEPEGPSSFGGLDRSLFSFQPLIDTKTVCSMAENPVLCVSILVRHNDIPTILISSIIRRVADIFT